MTNLSQTTSMREPLLVATASWVLAEDSNTCDELNDMYLSGPQEA